MFKNSARGMIIAVGVVLGVVVGGYLAVQFYANSQLAMGCEKEIQHISSDNGFTAFVHLVDCGAMDSEHQIISLSANTQFDRSSDKVVSVFGGHGNVKIIWDEKKLNVSYPTTMRPVFKKENHEGISIVYTEFP